MSKTLAVAKYLNELNVERHGCDMDEMKMHKMMYFSEIHLKLGNLALFLGA